MALAGDHVKVTMDDSSGTPREFANGDITSVDLGLTNDQHDVSGFGDAAHKFINGQVQAPVTLRGFVTTTADIGTHPVINGAFQAGAQVTLRVAVGDNAAPDSGDPEYSGEFLVERYTPTLESTLPCMLSHPIMWLGIAPLYHWLETGDEFNLGRKVGLSAQGDIKLPAKP